MNAHRISYTLDQEDYVQALERTQSESWTEWTLTGGFGINFPEFKIRYEGALTLGTGQPMTQRPTFVAELGSNLFAAGTADFLVAPNGALSLDETTVIAHQVTIAVPLSK